MDYAQTYDEMNIVLGDTENITFTPEEKARALKKAWNDSYVVSYVTDSSLTFSNGVNSYATPTGFTVVTEIGISPGNSLASDFVSPIPGNIWETQGSNITFKNNANSILSSNYTLYLKGRYKYSWQTDTLPTPNLQEYVIALGAYNTLGLLGYKKANLFLKNDLTMAELIALKREMKQEVLELRGKLQRVFEGA